jgi:hypothetical protein
LIVLVGQQLLLVLQLAQEWCLLPERVLVEKEVVEVLVLRVHCYLKKNWLRERLSVDE